MFQVFVPKSSKASQASSVKSPMMFVAFAAKSPTMFVPFAVKLVAKSPMMLVAFAAKRAVVVALVAKKVSPMRYPSPAPIPPDTTHISGLHGNRAAHDCRSENGNLYRVSQVSWAARPDGGT